MRIKRLLGATLSILLVVGALPVSGWADDAEEQLALGEGDAASQGEAYSDDEEAAPEAGQDEDSPVVAPESGTAAAESKAAALSDAMAMSLDLEEGIEVADEAAPQSDDETVTISGITYAWQSATATLTITGTGSETVPGYLLIAKKSGALSGYAWATEVRRVVVGEGIVGLAAYAFGYSSATYASTWIEEVEIGSSCATIGNYAFANCTSLRSEVFSPSNPCTALGTYTFRQCTSLVTAQLPPQVSGTLTSTFYGCTSLQSVDIPAGVTALSGTFKGCTSLQSVDIPAGVTTLTNTFDGCTSLRFVDIPAGVTRLFGTFYGCTSLESIVLPAALTSYGEYPFAGCTSLKTIYPEPLPEGVILDGGETFKNCSSLTGTITVRESVTVPSSDVFEGTSAFVLYLGSDPLTWSNIKNSGVRCEAPNYVELGPGEFVGEKATASAATGIYRLDWDSAAGQLTLSLVKGGTGKFDATSFKTALSEQDITATDVKTMVFGAGITAVPTSFSTTAGLKALQKVVVGRDVETLNSDTFSEASSLTQFEIEGDADRPSKLTTILGSTGRLVFAFGTKLEALDLRYTSITEMTANILGEASVNLSKLQLPLGLKTMDARALQGVVVDCDFTVPSTVQKLDLNLLYGTAYVSTSSAKNYTMTVPASVTQVVCAAPSDAAAGAWSPWKSIKLEGRNLTTDLLANANYSGLDAIANNASCNLAADAYQVTIDMGLGAKNPTVLVDHGTTLTRETALKALSAQGVTVSDPETLAISNVKGKFFRSWSYAKGYPVASAASARAASERAAATTLDWSTGIQNVQAMYTITPVFDSIVTTGAGLELKPGSGIVDLGDAFGFTGNAHSILDFVPGTQVLTYDDGSIVSQEEAGSVGTYLSKLEPLAGYCWADGTTDPIWVAWRIALSLAPTTPTVPTTPTPGTPATPDGVGADGSEGTTGSGGGTGTVPTTGRAFAAGASFASAGGAAFPADEADAAQAPVEQASMGGGSSAAAPDEPLGYTGSSDEPVGVEAPWFLAWVLPLLLAALLLGILVMLIRRKRDDERA